MQITYKLLIAFAFLALTACERPGPAERAGEEIDEAVEDVARSAEEAGEEAGDIIEDAGDEVEEATDEMGGDIDDVKESVEGAMEDMQQEMEKTAAQDESKEPR